MGANDGFILDNEPRPEGDLVKEHWSVSAEKELDYKADMKKSFQEDEQPLTHHQQAVKDFMIALTMGRQWDTPDVVNKAVSLADAFINQINKSNGGKV